MLRHFSLMLIFLLGGYTFAQGIEFTHGTWSEILKIAEESNKPIVVDAYASWCGPCKWMAANTFTNEEVGDFVNENFVPYKMDMEKGEGVDFAKKYNVRAYPTILFFNPSGELVHKGVGALDAVGFLELCKDALDSEKQYFALRKRYEEGENSKAFLKKYLTASMRANEKADEAFDAYWEMSTAEEKVSEDMLQLMGTLSSDLANFESDMFSFFMEHQSEYEKSSGSEVIDQIIKQAYNSAIMKAIRIEDQAMADQLLEKMKEVFPSKAHELVEYYQYAKSYYSSDEEEKNSAKKDFLAVTTDWQILNSEAWDVYENSDKEEELKYALELVDRSIKINSSYYNLDTKAALLYKLGEYKKAHKTMNEALSAADEDQDTSASEEMMEAIKKQLNK